MIGVVSQRQKIPSGYHEYLHSYDMKPNETHRNATGSNGHTISQSLSRPAQYACVKV